MDALLLGLAAALLWGLHDFTARIIGQRVDALVLLAVVFLTGILALAPLTVNGDWALLTTPNLGLALLAGLAYTCAGYGLYRALAIGPVYLVAPICGAFPLISVALQVSRGDVAGWPTWAAAAVIVAGIALVARSTEHDTGHQTSHGPTAGRSHAIGWATLSCFGFAFTFALSQWASEGGAHLPVTLITRVTAFVITVALLFALRPPIRPTLASWRPMVLMGLLDAAALTAVTFAGGMRNAEYASVAASVFGVITILLAWRFLHERLGPVQWIGCALVFSGILALGLTGHGGHG